jgi:hypothetical protein
MVGIESCFLLDDGGVSRRSSILTAIAMLWLCCASLL